MHGIVDKRLLFVTGKGGVGKSTIAAVMGLVAARRGLRTIVAELAGQKRLQHLFERDGDHFQEIELAPGLFTISIDPQQAMEEYLVVKSGVLGHVVASSRLFQALAMATPGMRELLSIGKAWELAQPQRRTRGGAAYDVVVVDAPATGHGVGILRTPRTFAEIARVGPIAHQARTIAATIDDRRFTGVIAVTTPEEMPINETLELGEALGREGMELDAVIVNAVYPARFDGGEIAELAHTLIRTSSRLARTAVRAALSEHSRAKMQREQAARLHGSFGGRLIELPYVFADELGPAEVEMLADALEGPLAGPGAASGGGARASRASRRPAGQTQALARAPLSAGESKDAGRAKDSR